LISLNFIKIPDYEYNYEYKTHTPKSKNKTSHYFKGSVRTLRSFYFTKKRFYAYWRHN